MCIGKRGRRSKMSRFDKCFIRRAKRNRYKLRKVSKGVARLSVFRSSRHIYAQLIDDSRGVTLCSASSLEEDFREKHVGVRDCIIAENVGKIVGERALQAGITHVVFDRGGFKFHGRVKALADGARQSGLKF